MLALPGFARAAVFAEPISRCVADRRCGIVLALASVGLAVLLGLVSTVGLPAGLLEEGGPVETATLYLYLAGAPARWRAPAVTLLTFAVLMVLAKVFDRLPAALVELRVLETMPALLRTVLLALEEVLELGLPVLAMLAVVQGRDGEVAREPARAPVSRGG